MLNLERLPFGMGDRLAHQAVTQLRASEQLHWQGAWHVDVDQIQLATVEPFLGCSDFFTIDFADSIGGAIDAAVVGEFVSRHAELQGRLNLPEIGAEFTVDHAFGPIRPHSVK